MSKGTIVEIIESKIKNRTQKIENVVSSEGEDSESVQYVFIDLDLYFTGLKDGLEAFGYKSEAELVDLALAENNAEKDLRQRRAQLRKALG